MKIRIDRGDHYVEYNLWVILLRVFILILIMSMVIGSINLILNSNESQREFEEALDTSLEQSYEELAVKQNSRGSFYSLKENVYVEGSIDSVIRNKEEYISFGSNFKITNNYNLYLLLATTPTGKSQIRIGKLLGNVGKQEYKVPNKTNLDVHQYVILWDDKSNEALAYAKIEN